MLSTLAALFGAFMALFGWYEEDVLTTQQCLEMQNQGYVIYQLNDAEERRLEKCREMLSEQK